MIVNFVENYLENVINVLKAIEQDSQPAIHQAAEAVAAAIQNGGMFILYGSGHSALVAKDAAYRAGGLAPAMAIDDIADGDAERLEGLAQYILARYDPHPNSVLAIISNSGINSVPIEMAMLAKAGGLKVIAITSLSHSHSTASRHSSGKKLFELADIVIDTHGTPGDASIQLPNSSYKTGATSTIAGSAILQAITVQAAALLNERGIAPPLWVSANVEGGSQHNTGLLERYRPQMARYAMGKTPSILKNDGK